MTLILDDIRSVPGMVVNAPSIFKRQDFMDWLNDPENTIFTWHTKGSEPSEYSDVVVLVNENYDGDSSNMPEDIWNLLCDEAYQHYGAGNSVTPRRHIHFRFRRKVPGGLQGVQTAYNQHNGELYGK